MAAASTVAVCARGPLRGYSIAFNFNLMPKEDRPAIVNTILYHDTVAKIQKEISIHGCRLVATKTKMNYFRKKFIRSEELFPKRMNALKFSI